MLRLLVVAPGGERLALDEDAFAIERVDAPALASAASTAVDAIVTTGIDHVAALRAAAPAALILARTSLADATRALALGATDYALATDDAAALATRIHGLFARRAAAQAAITDDEHVRALALFPELNPTAVMRLSAAGTVLYANPAALELSRTLGLALAALLPADTARIVREVVASDHAWPVLETKHGARTLSWTFLPIAAQQIVHCYAADITDRLLLEEQLRQSQKLDAIGHLAGGIAHDFNNLLTVVIANTALLQRAQPSEGLRSIAAASDRAAALVRQLLAFSRQQVLELRDLELNLTVVKLLKLLERVVREDIELDLDLAEHPVWARADAGMLDQILMNLVVNARDAMPNGGKIVLSTSVFVLDDEDKRAMPELAPGAYARLRVTDAGTGIAPENLARVFDPFFTTKEPGSGTGLGLATVFGIVKQHAGAIAVTSEVGRGTTFSILIPTARETRYADHVPGEPKPVAPRGGSESILVVEDEAPVRELVEQVLATSGYRVHVMPTGAAAIAALATMPPIDLLLTDMVMPGGVSGRELADRVRAAIPSIKVVYTSGYANAVGGDGLALVAGVNYLPKPFTPVALLACVRACLDGVRR
jgi:signal transduction histidine kinase